MIRGKCKTCGKMKHMMQGGGPFFDKTGYRGLRYPQLPLIDIQQPTIKEDEVDRPIDPMQYQLPENRIWEGIHNGIIEGPNGEDPSQYYAGLYSKPQMKNNTYPQNFQNTGIALQQATGVLSELSGIVDRKRQNQYDYLQQTALGQMNGMPVDDYQPNPYSLYAKYGGKLKDYMKYGGLQHAKYFGPPFSNGATYKFSDSERYDKGSAIKTARHIVHFKEGGNWLKDAVNPEHKGYCTPMTKATCTPRRKAFAMTMKKHHGFHEEGGLLKKGGLTPNKAREILHDGTAQGHPLTDKQRRFFGAKSKGNTMNYRGHKKK